MNTIEIFAPRWRDRAVLIADWKIGLKNRIDITCKKSDGSRRYPEPIIKAGWWLKQYPVEQIQGRPMRKVPLDDLLQMDLTEELCNNGEQHSGDPCLVCGYEE